MSFNIQRPASRISVATNASLHHVRRHRGSILIALWFLVSAYPVFIFLTGPASISKPDIWHPANYFLRTQPGRTSGSLGQTTIDGLFGGFNITGRESDVVDTFSNFTKTDTCNMSSLELHRPFAPLCDTTDALMTAMSYGGRNGMDAPYAPRGCDMRWFSTAELCDIMSRFGRISVIGDSMSRNLVVAMHLLLRQDLYNGGKATWMSTKPGRDCTCRAPFEDGQCIFNTAFSSKALFQHDAKSMACPHDRSGMIEFMPLLRAPLSSSDLRNLASPFSSTPPSRQQVFVLGHGVWNSLNASATRQWVGQVEETLLHRMPYLARPGAAWPRLFLTPSAAQENKPHKYSKTQGNFAIKRFEEEVGPWVKSKGYAHLGLWNLTTQTHSPDGTHAGMRSNLIKAMMVFNWMSRIEVPADQPPALLDDNLVTTTTTTIPTIITTIATTTTTEEAVTAVPTTTVAADGDDNIFTDANIDADADAGAGTSDDGIDSGGAGAGAIEA